MMVMIIIIILILINTTTIIIIKRIFMRHLKAKKVTRRGVSDTVTLRDS